MRQTQYFIQNVVFYIFLNMLSFFGSKERGVNKSSL